MKHLVKISRFGGQFRLTIPRKCIEAMGWEDCEYVVVEESAYKMLKVRRFIDGESLKGAPGVNKSGSD